MRLQHEQLSNIRKLSVWSCFGNGLGRNCIIFGAHLSSSSHDNNKKKIILVLGKDSVQRINGKQFMQKNHVKSVLLKKK